MDQTSDDKIIAATREEVIAFGLRRATMTSIAKRAGIGRATLYRRAASLDELVRDALVVEYTRAFEIAGTNRHADTVTRSDIVAFCRAAVEHLGDDEFSRSLLDHDPELLLPYLVDRLGRSQEVFLAAMEMAIRAAQDDGSVRDADARVLAVGALQALTPFVIGRRMLDGVASRDVWLDEAAHLLDAYLAPKDSAHA